MIRAQVRWWPGNVTPGGRHIHHVIFGVIFMLIGGVGGIALSDSALWPLCVLSAIFGIGAGLVLDEFALILNLEDVYWAKAGRTSVDAIFVAVAMVGLLLIGARPLEIGSDNSSGVAGVVSTIVVAFFYVTLAGITLLKGKVWTGLLGVFIPLLLLVGAIRVARPHSPWARWRYHRHRRRGAARMARAERRERRYREPLIRAKIRLQEAVAGRPNVQPLPAESGAGADPPPDEASQSAVSGESGVSSEPRVSGESGV